MRVLLAPTEIAGQLSATARGLRAAGLDAVSCNYYRRSNPFGYPCDRELALDERKTRWGRRFRRYAFFLKALGSYDVFHFHFGRTLLHGHGDLPVLKLLGRKMVAEFWGSDVRRPAEGLTWAMDGLPAKDEGRIRDNLRALGRHIRVALVADLELKRYVEEYFEDVVVVPQRVVLDRFEPRFPDPGQRRPLIVHAPTNRQAKGSDALIEAVGVLKQRHDFEFRLVEGMSNDAAREVYRQADVIVDQLRVGTHGLFAVETMALGKPVITYIREEYRGSYPDDLPIVSAGTDSVGEKLAELLTDGVRRHELGVKGRAYVERRHDATRVAEQLARIYEGL